MFRSEWQGVTPASVGIDQTRLDRARSVLRSGVGSVFPGATVCAFRQGQCFLDEAYGTLDGTVTAEPNSLYDLASLTKPIATAPSVLALVERGELSYSQRLSEFFEGGNPEVTIRHLVLHTSGLPAWIACYNAGPGTEAAVRAILALPTKDRPAPGTHYEYSCLNYILLGRIVRMVSGQPLDKFVRDTILGPLGLLDTTYLPHAVTHPRIAPTRSEEGPEETHPVVLRGVVHDGNARGIGGVSGNSGLFGTARDVARFGNALLHPGGEARLFGAPAMAQVWRNQISGVGGQTALFFASGNEFNPAGDLLSSRTVGHSGFAGTALTIDPEYDLSVAVLTNTVYTQEPGAKGRWLKLRRRFLNALAAALQ